ncbi:MAG: DJ-1/PfpI family protein [Tannerellaceae bacterium]|nr:DJ-1/PfpI family protein [Tannerellaceae bacterium]
MEKNVAIIAVNPVNGSGLFQYLEAFYENGISYKVFAVAETKEISTNSGIAIRVDDVIANLKGNEDQFDALVFACGDAMPVFSENASAPYNQDMMQVIATFGQKDKILIGHCVGGMLFDFAGAASGKKVAVHPLAKSAVQQAIATDKAYEVDSNIYTAQTENTIVDMIGKVVEVLK